MGHPTKDSLDKLWRSLKGFAQKSGTTFHPNPVVTEAVVSGLAAHVDELLSGQTGRSEASPLDLRL